MRIRTFTADNAQAAMAKVRAELGPDAVIIAMDETAKGGGVIVRAAIEAEAEPAPAADIEGATPVPFDLEARLDQLLTARLRTPQRLPRPGRDAGAIASALAFHRVPENLAAALSDSAARSRDADAGTALADALGRHIDTTPLPEIPDHPLLLVGAPGAGKTSVAARLALRAVAAGAKPLLISLDGDKAGARAQIEIYAERLKFDARIALNPGNARAIADKYKDGPVIVDSTGMSVFDAADLAGLRDTIARLAVETIAVVSAGLDAQDAADAATIYAGLGVKMFICTRLDGTRRLGGLIAAAAGGLALAQTTSSPLIGRGLDSPDAAALARLLLASETAIPSAHAA